jgi:hypothetical protein
MRIKRQMRLAYLSLLVGPYSFSCAAGQCQDHPPGKDQSLTQPLVTFDPNHQRPLTYVDKSIKVDLKIGRERDSLNVLYLTEKSQKSLALPLEMAQVDEIRRVTGDKLLVRGMVNGSGSEVVVVDLKTATQTDKFVCYHPSVSPNGEFVAFVKFYPAHFAEGTADHYMLYELGKKPEDNRPKDVPSSDWQNVGRPMYPIGVGNRVADNIERLEGSQHQSSSGFFWNSNGTQLMFADRVNLAPEITFVLIDIEPDGRIRARTASQQIYQYCSKLEDPQAVRSCLLLVRKVEFHSPSEPAFTITLEIVNLHKVKSFDLNSSQFGPGT